MYADVYMYVDFLDLEEYWGTKLYEMMRVEDRLGACNSLQGHEALERTAYSRGMRGVELNLRNPLCSSCIMSLLIQVAMQRREIPGLGL